MDLAAETFTTSEADSNVLCVNEEGNGSDVNVSPVTPSSQNSPYFAIP